MRSSAAGYCLLYFRFYCRIAYLRYCRFYCRTSTPVRCNRGANRRAKRGLSGLDGISPQASDLGHRSSAQGRGEHQFDSKCLGPALTVLAYFRHRVSQRRRAIGRAQEPRMIATPDAAQVSGPGDRS